MASSSWTLFLLLLTVQGSVQRSTPESPTYKAAVVELRPLVYLDEADKTLNRNAKEFVRFIEQAAFEDADIVVFPELGLTTIDFSDRPDIEPWTTLVPHPSENYEACTNSSIPINRYFKMIACAAKRNSIYVSVNILEKELCSGKGCRPDGFFVYISNVSFDRTGKIVSRYRKTHLLDEYEWLDVMKTPEYSAFDTDFGVTFGNVICFDLLFEVPWLTESRRLNITDIIYTSGWFSEMPFLTSIQLQAGWAYIEDVNMLASGYNRIRDSYSGSGIFAGREGVLAAILPLTDHEELLVAEVRKKSERIVASTTVQTNHEVQFNPNYESDEQYALNDLNQIDDSRDFRWRYDNMDAFETKLITEDGLTVQSLAQNGIECDFKVNVTNLNPPVTYRLLAFDGVRKFGKVTVLGSRACVIIQCANNTLDSCSHIARSAATFNSISITARYVDNGRTILMPSTLGTNMLPLKNIAFDENKHGQHVNSSISLTKSAQNLVIFGLWGRNFEADIVNTAGIP